jgi:CheY-like chemotaxis protein
MSNGYVLIVDDDSDAREIQIEIVESMNLKTRVAENGVEALRYVEEQIPDLILLDIMMPKMSGFAVLARLRSAPSTRRIPIIVVTACGMNDRSSLMLPGVTEVVVKGTTDVEQFRALVARTLACNHITLPVA